MEFCFVIVVIAAATEESTPLMQKPVDSLDELKSFISQGALKRARGAET
jgi:hypothetical protein